jgi:hypothetical protein
MLSSDYNPNSQHQQDFQQEDDGISKLKDSVGDFFKDMQSRF